MTWEQNAGRKRKSKRPIRSEKVVRAFIALVSGVDLGYNDEGKRTFHERGNA